ncbi:MAG: hypothetical protein AAF512_24965, partial [Pseudomonadota bacterium]
MQEDEDWDIEQQEWLEALEDVLKTHGPRRAREILRALQNKALDAGISLEEATLNTPYRNTIPVHEQHTYPGDIELEERIE